MDSNNNNPQNYKVVNILKSIGYKYVHFSSGRSHTDHNMFADINIKFGPLNEFLMILAPTTMLKIIDDKWNLLRMGLRDRTLHTFSKLTKLEKIVGPKFFGSFALFSIQKQWIEDRKDDLSEQFEGLLLSDPVLHRVAGPEQVDQLARYAPIETWLESSWPELNKVASGIRFFEGEEYLILCEDLINDQISETEFKQKIIKSGEPYLKKVYSRVIL